MVDGSEDPWSQEGYAVRFDWGAPGAARVGAPAGVLVVVDVLSFTTAVTVAVQRGIVVYPAPWRDGRAAQLAGEVDAALAVERAEATSEHPWCLSPAALRDAEPVPTRLVLPSPNGSSIAAAAGGVVVVACLRNASAVAAWVRERFGDRDAPVSVIAAGERWRDGSLRPALEDLLGAAAVLAALHERGTRGESPEAELARAVWTSPTRVPDLVRRCASGVELARLGYGADVEIAVEVDSSRIVPVLRDGAFRPAGLSKL